MKIVVFSDVHGNFHSLGVFLEFFQNIKNTDTQAFCLGDTVGYGAYPSECLKSAKETASVVLSGNHERMLIHPDLRIQANFTAREAIAWTQKALSPSELDFIRSMPEKSMLNDEILLVHGSPADPDEYITNGSQAVRSIREMKKGTLFCFHGHTHMPGLFDEMGAYYYQPNTSVRLEEGRSYLINPGSVGQPRDRDPRGSFCVFNTETLTVSFIRYEYDIRAAADAIREKGLPESLGERLFHGI